MMEGDVVHGNGNEKRHVDVAKVFICMYTYYMIRFVPVVAVDMFSGLLEHKLNSDNFPWHFTEWFLQAVYLNPFQRIYIYICNNM